VVGFRHQLEHFQVDGEKRTICHKKQVRMKRVIPVGDGG
jgi:hypothetical protein